MDIQIPSFSDYAQAKLADTETVEDAEIVEEVHRPRIIKEWLCKGHGYFESTTPECPHGCTSVERAFLTAPGIRTNSNMTTADALQQRIAASYGLSNMKTPDIGQTMAGKLGPSVTFERPKTIDDVIRLNQQGIATGTVTVALGKDVAPAVSPVAQARQSFKDVPEVDGAQIARNRIQHAQVYKGDPKAEAEALQKMTAS